MGDRPRGWKAGEEGGWWRSLGEAVNDSQLSPQKGPCTPGWIARCPQGRERPALGPGGFTTGSEVGQTEHIPALPIRIMCS